MLSGLIKAERLSIFHVIWEESTTLSIAMDVDHKEISAMIYSKVKFVFTKVKSSLGLCFASALVLLCYDRCPVQFCIH